MKNIQITYLDREDVASKNTIVKISWDYANNYKESKTCYLYELFYIDKLEEIIKNREEELLKYGYINGDLTPFYIKIDDATFEELKEYFNHTTEYEEVLWNNDVSILNAILGIYRKDPKNWEL